MVEAKGEADLVFGANVTRQRNGLAFREALDGDGPDGPDLRGGWYWLVAACGDCRD
ncbi:MAG TPA: hypothetical protein VHT21_11800 [Stellaceae bacterium]|nr:hypothetical protein [Stellaceae bacterium]